MLIDEFRVLYEKQQFKEIVNRYIKLHFGDVTEKEFYSISYIAAKANFILGNSSTTLEIISKINSWAQENDEQLFISSRTLEANCYTSQRKLKEAQEIFEQLFSEFKNIEQITSYPLIILNYGHTLFYQGRIIDANEQYLKALELAKERGFPQDKIMNNLALTYNQLGEYNKAIEMAEKTIIEKEKLKDWHGWTIAKVNLSTFYSYLGDFERAHRNVDQALNFAEEKLYKRELAGAYSAKGAILIREKRIMEAQEHLEAARYMLESIGVRDILPETLVRLGFVYILLEQYDEVKNIISELDKLGEEQESYFLAIWSAILDALVMYEKEKAEDALDLIDKALKVSLEFGLYTVYFQATCIACYFYAAVDKIEKVKDIALSALEIATKQHSKINQIKYILSLSFLYMSMAKLEEVEKYETELQKLIEEHEIFSKDIEKLEKYKKELIEAYEEQREKVKEKAKKCLVDFLQRINPWF
ncbi:MAG: tetratricopeptide repeat protein [Candidatus Heimdallarchaeaceae archaeon]